MALAGDGCTHTLILSFYCRHDWVMSCKIVNFARRVQWQQDTPRENVMDVACAKPIAFFECIAREPCLSKRQGRLI